MFPRLLNFGGFISLESRASPEGEVFCPLKRVIRLILYFVFDRLLRHRVLEVGMSSRRATNNSSVASLEEQSAIIASVTSQSGLGAEVLGGLPSEKIKKKKTKFAKKASPPTSLGQGAMMAATVTSITTASGDGRAVTRASMTPFPGLLSTLPSSTFAPGAAQPITGQGTQAMPLIGGGAETLTTPSTSVPAASVAIGSGVQTPATPSFPQAWATGFADPTDLAVMQQQWLWQQQFQQMALNPFGNYVPNFNFGANVQADWAQEGEEEEEEPPPRARQGAHEISEDEDEDVVVIPSPAQSALAGAGDSGGKLEELARDQMAQVKEADRVAPEIIPDVAALLDKLLADSIGTADMEKLAKTYPRIKNVELMKVPRLDNEVFQAVDQNLKNVDQVFQGIQKVVLGAMAALTPVLSLGWVRSNKDPELNDLSQNLLDGIRLLAHTHNALSMRRRELLKPHLAPSFARFMTKGVETSPEWLYGGDLGETTKQCETAKKIGEKVLKRKPLQPTQRGGGLPQKRFKSPFGFPHSSNLRPYPFQAQHIRYPPQSFQGFQGFPPVFQGAPQWGGGFPRRFRFQGPRPQRQNFNKKSNYNK